MSAKKNQANTLTPHGLHYLLMRDRPLHPYEKMALQGYPTFSTAGLSDSQLSDLAGNAIGAAPFSLLLVCLFAAIPKGYQW